MAGTERMAEGLQMLRVSTVRASDSQIVNSLEGINIDTLTDGAVTYVEADDVEYRWFADSTELPSDPDVVLPLQLEIADPGRWILIESGTSVTAPLWGIRYVDQHTSVAVPNGSQAAPFSTISAALTSLSGSELTNAAGYTIYIVPGDYSAETVTLPGTQSATLSGMSGTFFETTKLGDITSVNNLQVSLERVHALSMTLQGTTNLWSIDSTIENALTFEAGGTSFYGGTMLFPASFGTNEIVGATEINSSSPHQIINDINSPSAGVYLTNASVLATTVSVSSILADGGQIAGAINCPGDFRVNNAEAVNGSLVSDGTIRIQNSGVGLTAIDTNNTTVEMFNCRFSTGTVVTFLGAAGTLLLDPTSNYFWGLAGGSVVNGSVVVTA